MLNNIRVQAVVITDVHMYTPGWRIVMAIANSTLKKHVCWTTLA